MLYPYDVYDSAITLLYRNLFKLAAFVYNSAHGVLAHPSPGRMAVELGGRLCQ